MTIQVKNRLTKSRNPDEHGFEIRNKIGEIIQVLGDGYCLVEFKMLVEPRNVPRHKPEKIKDYLQWYVHENDFI